MKCTNKKTKYFFFIITIWPFLLICYHWNATLTKNLRIVEITPNKTLKKICSHHQDQTLAEASKTVKCKSNCDCSGQAHKSNNKTGRPLQTRKRKQVAEKENIDSETLAKYKTLEWEERTGYWCQKCNIKFTSSDLLIDHMSKKDVHAKWKCVK